MADNLIHIPDDDTKNYTLYVSYNQWLKSLDTQLNELTNQNLIKVPNVVRLMNKKTLLLTFGSKCNKQPNVPFLPVFNPII